MTSCYFLSWGQQQEWLLSCCASLQLYCAKLPWLWICLAPIPCLNPVVILQWIIHASFPHLLPRPFLHTASSTSPPPFSSSLSHFTLFVLSSEVSCTWWLCAHLEIWWGAWSRATAPHQEEPAEISLHGAVSRTCRPEEMERLLLGGLRMPF